MIHPLLACILVFAISFLLGSIPSGLIIGKLVYGVDIREVGSGNIGTTNAIRALGKKGGYIVFLLDYAKGIVSGLIGMGAFSLVSPDGSPVGGFMQGDFLAAAFLACVMGHVFSPWLGFRGGKGIAVAIGCLFITYGPYPAIVELVAFVLVVMLTKYVSAGSIAAAAICPILAFIIFGNDIPAALMCSAGAIIVIWAHRENIARLRAGTERKIGEKGTKAS